MVTRVPTLLISLILLTAPAWVAGQQQTPDHNNTRAQRQFKTGPVTTRGCLTGSEGRYTLATDTGDLYVLTGNPAEFQRYNGKRVRISGTQKPPDSNQPMGVLKYPPSRLQVSKITKLADTCDGNG